MEVRRMRPDELERVIALWNETADDTYGFIEVERVRSHAERRAFFLERVVPECEFWVATEGDELLGFVALKGSYVDRLYVRPGRQRGGAGSALIERARQESPAGLELHTHVRNAGARAFYEKHGFEAVRFGISPPPESEPDVEYHWRPDRNARS